MKNLFLFAVFSIFFGLYSCHKEENHVFVKTVYSLFDGDLIIVKRAEFESIVENPDAIQIVVFCKWENNDWLLVNDLNGLKCEIKIDDSGDVFIIMDGAPIDPAALVKIVIK